MLRTPVPLIGALGLTMDYAVRRKPRELDSTGFMEIGPGRYSGKHWQEGFIFIWGDAFSLAEGIIRVHFPDYDRLAMNDIPREVGIRIVIDLQRAAVELESANETAAAICLHIPEWLSEQFPLELASHRTAITVMLEELAGGLDRAYQSEDYACILGV